MLSLAARLNVDLLLLVGLINGVTLGHKFYALKSQQDKKNKLSFYMYVKIADLK